MKLAKKLLSILLIIPIAGLIVLGAYLEKKINLIDKVITPIVKKTDKELDNIKNKYDLQNEKVPQDKAKNSEQSKDKTENKEKVVSENVKKANI